MSAESLPITPSAFAAALPALSLASLHLKTLELRNALAHLAYSNAQLQPFANGTAGETALNPQPDPDCADAIRENEVVMARMRERILLVRAEVEARGVSWREFEGGVEDEEPGVAGNNDSTMEEVTEEGSRPLVNGVDDGAEAANNTATRGSGNPWTDGTFQIGVIRNGEIHMDAVPPPSQPQQQAAATTTSSATAASGSGGRLTDEELRRLLEARLEEDADAEEDGGLHL